MYETCVTQQGRIQDFSKGGGSILGLQAKKKGGGPEGGPTLGSMLKSLHSGPKRGARTPWPRPGSAHA